MNKKKYYLLSFIIPMVLLFIVSTICGYIPFGAYTFNKYDAFYEYPTFLVELGNIIRSGRTIFYTLHGGLGVNFFSILNLYGGSPLNIFSVFFDNTTIYIFYAILIYIKMGLAGLTMAIYLNSLNTKYKDSIWNICFSLLYSFSGWVIAMNMHIMWLDAYVLLPLIIKGLDKLIIANKYLEYTLFLALAIIINYYTGFMLCLFMVIYFVYKSLVTNNFTKKTILRFSIFSIIAALISCVILIPTYYNLTMGRLAEIDFSASYFNIDWFQALASIYNMSIGSFIAEDHYEYGSTTLYISIFALVLIIKYFLNKKVTKKNKLVTLLTILFFQLSFALPLIDYIWNLGQQPIWWEHRYQFVYIFFTITVAYESFCWEDAGISPKKKSIISLIFMLLLTVSFSYKVLGLQLSNYRVLMVFMSIILFYIYLSQTNYKKWLIILIILELSVNAYTTLYVNRGFKYEDIVNENKEVNQILNNIDAEDYRVLSKSYSDAGLMFGFNSIEIFSSSYNNNVLQFLNNLNMLLPTNNSLVLKSYNPAVLSLLGVKYLITGESNYFACEDSFCFNDLALPFVLSVSSRILDVSIGTDQEDNLNNIYTALTGEDVNLYLELDIATSWENIEVDEDGNIKQTADEATIITSATVQKDSLVIPNNNTLLMERYWGTTTIMINDEEYNISEQGDYLIRLEAGDTITITYAYNEETNSIDNLDDHLFVALDLEVYEDSLKKILEQTNYTSLDDNRYIIKGEIEVNNELLFITIPYDEGLIIKIDDEEVAYFKVLDTFIGVFVAEGTHTIEITYIPKGLKEGLVISIITLLGLGIYAKLVSRGKK